MSIKYPRRYASIIHSIIIAMLLSMLSLLNAGCASIPQLVNDNVSQVIPKVPTNKAQIIFFNPSNSVAGAFLSEVYELEGERRKLLGMAGSKMKIVAEVSPGDYMFMCRTGLRSHFMMAEGLEAGKRYYVLMRFIYGAGFQLRPIRNGGESDYSSTHPEFERWLSTTKVVGLMPDTESWVNQNFGKHVDKSYDEYWVEWQQKSEEQKAELTLKSEDALSI